MNRASFYLLALTFAAGGAAQTPAPKAAPKAADKPIVNPANVTPPVTPTPFTATAYSTKGNTVKGVQTQPGVVAADPHILPLGSIIRVTDAGRYSGQYVVTDLGVAIVGRRIDIFVAEPAEARAFGKKQVQVEIVKTGDNVKFKPETTNTIPKASLAPAEKKDAAAIPSNKVPADKPAVEEGRAVNAQEKAATAKQ
jgi:3D (Asp-Asp-Asp) domain-containing protein